MTSVFILHLFDKLHFSKIELADEILVLNLNGYIGSSTTNEIKYATQLGKTIRYLENKKNHYLYHEQELCSQNTFYSFLQYGGQQEYINAQLANKNRGISAEVTFTKKPKLYFDLLVNDFIKAFLANEKVLAQQNFTQKLNTQIQLGIDTTIKFKI